MALLEVRGLHVDYDGAAALTDVSLEVEAGETVALVGSNGAGKSTLMATIAGLKAPRSGSISFEGRQVAGMPAEQLCQMGIALVPEGRGLFARLTVQRNLLLGAYRRRDPAFRKRTLDLVHELFPILQERQHQLAGTLSGGEQQMLAIGRALMSDPRLLLLDEPTMGIAPILVTRVLEALGEISQHGITMLLVEQRLHRALERADRGYVMQTGSIVLSGRSQELLESDSVREAYLGM